MGAAPVHLRFIGSRLAHIELISHPLRRGRAIRLRRGAWVAKIGLVVGFGCGRNGEPVSYFTIVIVALGLSMDTLAIAAAVGMGYQPITFRTVFRIGWHFTLFQVGLLVLGYEAGAFINQYLSAYDHWLAAGLLWAIGGHMLWEWYEGKLPTYSSDPSRGLSLVVLSVATSIDALAVGGSLGLTGQPIGLAAVVLAVMTAGLAVVGLEFGRRLGGILGRWALLAGGVALTGLGVKTLVNHLAG